MLDTLNWDVPSLVFYAFAAIVTACAVAVITARNPVHSVFYLIFAFFNAAGLFVLLGAEYLAMTLVIVYVGAVAVLFLFVVMMLHIDIAELRAGFARYVPIGVLVAVALFVEMGALFYASFSTGSPLADAAHVIPDAEHITNTKAIGLIMYTDYIFLFQLAGIILLVAMIGAIVLTLREREGVRRQRIDKQVARTRTESVQLVKIKPGQGA